MTKESEAEQEELSKRYKKASTTMWEHYLELLEADAQQQPEFIQQFYPSDSVPRYALQSLLPRLNQLGEQGWEIVQIQPVMLGKNGDVLINGAMSEKWTRTYLCVFKRYTAPTPA